MPAGSGTYHHGDLRRTLLAAAVEMIAEHGPAQVSLRDLARRAGVSHAAPTHHFKDKTGLFTAIATEGYQLLSDSLTGADPSDLRNMGRRYVAFALAHPAHFTVMFDRSLVRNDDPELAAATSHAGSLLRAAVTDVPPGRRGPDADMAELAAWSLAHGFATLALNGNLDHPLAHRNKSDYFYALTELLFA
jgi:AcrR family transcriptional regulator